jgi:cytochrome c-type biogenesis protein
MFDVTFPAAFIAGLLTFFAPCTFVTLPYFLSFLTAQSFGLAHHDVENYRWKIFLSALIYVSGFLLVFTLLGYSASEFGRFLKFNKTIFLQFGAIFIIFFGIFMLFGEKVKSLYFLQRERKFRIDHSHQANTFVFPFLIGMTSAFAWTPCIGPILGTILFVASYTTTKSTEGALLLFTYGLGITLPFLLIAFFFSYTEKWIRKLNKYTGYVYKFSGILLILLGFAILTGYSGTIFAEIYKVFIRFGYRPQ